MEPTGCSFSVGRCRPYLALTDLEDVRGNREIVDDVIANARKNYLDLMRRRKPLILADEEETRFQRIMDRLQARIRFFGGSA